MSVTRITKGEESEKVISLLAAAFVDDPVVNYITRKDDKTPYAVRCLFEQIVPFCLTPTTNVLLNSDGNATILWWKNTESPLGLWFIIKSLMNLSTWLDIVGSYSGVLTAIDFMRIVSSKAPTYPHLYVYAVAVDPFMKRKGLGSAMMKIVTDYADKYNYPVYLENSKEQNLQFYQKHGFIVLERLQLFSDSPWMWRMLRPMKDPKRPVGQELSECSVF